MPSYPQVVVDKICQLDGRVIVQNTLAVFITRCGDVFRVHLFVVSQVIALCQRVAFAIFPSSQALSMFLSCLMV